MSPPLIAGKFTARTCWKCLGIISLIFLITWVGGAFGRIWYQQQLHHISRQTRLLEQEIQKLQRRQTQLQTKIAEIHSPSRLKSLAGQLHSPIQERLIHVAWQDLQQGTRRVAAGRKAPHPPEMTPRAPSEG